MKNIKNKTLESIKKDHRRILDLKPKIKTINGRVEFVVNLAALAN